MKEDETIRIKHEYHIGWFIGSYNGRPKRPFIGVGSEYKNDPMMGDWFTVSEAKRLRDALAKVLSALEGNP